MDINTPYIKDEKVRDVMWKSMKGELKYTLMNDFLSKYSFQKDLYALKGLLAALLKIDLDEITDILIMNPIEPGEQITDKDCILDIKLEMNHSTVINIEFQATFQDFWTERSIVYLSRNINQLKEGESYKNLKPCIHIGILDRELFKPDDSRYTGEFYSEYRILNTKTYSEYSSKFSIIVLSLKNIENASDSDKEGANSIYHWGKIFRARSWEELKMLAKDNDRMESFVGTIKQLTAEEEVAEACERRRRYLNDIATYEDEIKSKELELKAKYQELEARDQELATKDQELEAKDQELEAKDQELATKDQELATKDQEIANLKKMLEDMKKGQ